MADVRKSGQTWFVSTVAGGVAGSVAVDHWEGWLSWGVAIGVAVVVMIGVLLLLGIVDEVRAGRS